MHAVEVSFKILRMEKKKNGRKKSNNVQKTKESSQNIRGWRSRKSGKSKKTKMVSQLHRVLRKTYYDPKESGSFGGATRLFQAAREKLKRIHPQLRKEEVTKWLEGEEAYTLHKPVRHKFPRNKVYVTFKDQQFEADLVDMSHLQKHNDGYKYLLTCIDVLSRYAWAIPLKNKSGIAVTKAFESILVSSKRYCQKLHTDEGKEFYNGTFQTMLEKYESEHFSSGNKDIKCSIVERFNRTLKTRMYRYFTAKSTNRYIDVLPELVDSYNRSGMAPADVTDENQRKVWEKLYGGRYPTSDAFTFHVGDQVRVSRIKGRFE